MEFAHLLLATVVIFGLMGYWCNRVRHIRREKREIAAMRATVEANLRRSEAILQQLVAFPGDDDDAHASPLH